MYVPIEMLEGEWMFWVLWFLLGIGIGGFSRRQPGKAALGTGRISSGTIQTLDRSIDA